MSEFREAIEPARNAKESEILSQMYFRQSYLADLSLITFTDRFDFLEGHLLQMMNQPHDPTLIAILFRLLLFYSVMSEKRRTADIRIKSAR